jgi:hypothetical protein
MRCILIFIMSIFIKNILQCQIRLSDKDFKAALPVAEKYLLGMFGKKVFEKSIKVDFDISRENTDMDYDKKHKESGQDHFIKYSDLFFWVITDKDTIGNFNILVDSTGKLFKNSLSMDLSSSYSPVLIAGYKKLLFSEFKIGFKEAKEIGGKHGFKFNPMFQVEMDSGYNLVKDKVFLKAKFVWWFSEADDMKGYNKLYLNAETGKIEKEEYVKTMPQ